MPSDYADLDLLISDEECHDLFSFTDLEAISVVDEVLTSCKSKRLRDQVIISTVELDESRKVARTECLKRFIERGKFTSLNGTVNDVGTVSFEKYRMIVPLRILNYINSGSMSGLGTFLKDVCVDDCFMESLTMTATGVFDIILYWAVLFDRFPDLIMDAFEIEEDISGKVSVKFAVFGTPVYSQPVKELFASVKSKLPPDPWTIIDDISEVVASCLVNDFWDGKKATPAPSQGSTIFRMECDFDKKSLKLKSIAMKFVEDMVSSA